MSRALVSAAMLCVWACGAAAQTEPPVEPETLPVVPVDEAAPSEDEAAPLVLDDIVVTASKREAASRDLPASVLGLDGLELERLGATEMRDFLRRIPGVQLTELQPDLFRVSIRGIQADVSAVTPQTEGVFIDDVPLNDPFLMLVRPDVALFDLDRIEVMKGPQGTLFGGSGLAGAIRYQLADARPGEWNARAFAHYQTQRDGSPNRTGGVALNVPIGADAALRLVGTRRETGGTIDDTRNGLVDTDRLSSSSGRALVRWHYSDALSVGAKYYRQEGEAEDLPWADTTDGRLERSQRVQKSPSTTRFDVGSVDVHLQTAWGEFTSITGTMAKASSLLNAYGEQAMGTQASGQPVTYPTADDTEGLTQELRLASTGQGRWRWLVGLYGQRYHSVSLQRVYAQTHPLLPQESLLDFRSDVTAHEWAAFGEGSLELSEAWRATLGARAYRVETAGAVDSSGPIILATGNSENHNDAAERASGVNPKLALEWQALENLRTYATIARGFRFGGIQIIGPSPAAPDVPETYESDSLWNYEIGMRSDWLDGALRVDGAAFLMDWKDPQVQMSTEGAVALNLIDNAERARSQGVEISVRYLTPLDGLAVDAAASYTDARITEPYTGQGETVPAGSRLPGYSDFQGSAALEYARGFGPVLATMAAIYTRQGAGVSDILQSMPIYDYETTDLRVTLQAPGVTLRPVLSFGVVNVFDERALVSAYYIEEGNVFTVYNRPRSADLRLELAF